MTTEIGAAAVRLCELELCVLPAHYPYLPNQWHAEPWCSCRLGRHCDKPGKHPIRKWNERDLPAPLGVDALAAYWQHDPRYNISLFPGHRSGGVVLADVDPRRGGRLETLWDMGWPQRTPTEQTGGGGWHVYARVPAGVSRLATVHEYAQGIELLADGGHVIVAPSLHASGRRYEWLPGLALRECPPAAVPPDVLAAIQERHEPEPEPSEPITLAPADLDGLARRAPGLLARALARVQANGGHSRYPTLKWLSRQLWSLRLSPEALEYYLMEYGKAVWPDVK